MCVYLYQCALLEQKEWGDYSDTSVGVQYMTLTSSAELEHLRVGIGVEKELIRFVF